MSDNENYSEENEEIEEEQLPGEENLQDQVLDEDENEDDNAKSEENDDQNNEVSQTDNTNESRPKLAKTKKVINTKKLQKYSTADENKGVIYLSSVPMFMSPKRLRIIMGEFGEIGSLYLAPEGKDAQKSRKKNGGNGKKRWVEGWVEFMDKKIARRVAESLNGTPVGGSKRSKFHDQLWNIKYLKGVKWRHLKEQMAYEISVRKTKLRAAISKGKREMEEYRKNFETSKRIAKRKRMEALEGQSNNNNNDTNEINNNDNDEPPKKIEKKSPKAATKQTITDPRFQTIKPKLAAISDPRFKVDNSSKWKTDFEDPFGETTEDGTTHKKKFKSK